MLRKVARMLQVNFKAPRAHLVLDGEVDEVGVHQHLVGRPQLRVVLEKQRGRHLVAARAVGAVCGGSGSGDALGSERRAAAAAQPCCTHMCRTSGSFFCFCCFCCFCLGPLPAGSGGSGGSGA